MILKDFLPDPALRDFVRWYRICHFEFTKNTPIPVKAYPPKPEDILHFFLRDSCSIMGDDGRKKLMSPITIIGQRTFVTQQYNGNNFLNFQIVFQPTALFRLTGVPSFKLANQFVDAECIISKDLGLTFERLQSSKDFPEMLTAGEEFVRTLVSNARKEPHHLDTVAKFMIKVHGQAPMDWLAKESCLCNKQFMRKFNERIGINPKSYARIIRFNHAFNIKNLYPERDWLTIAVDCGYCDYQHMVKDYKSFTGLTPNEFHVLENSSPERVLGLTREVYQSRLTQM